MARFSGREEFLRTVCGWPKRDVAIRNVECDLDVVIFSIKAFSCMNPEIKDSTDNERTSRVARYSVCSGP